MERARALDRELAEKAMVEKGFVDQAGKPDWNGLADSIRLSRLTMKNIRLGYTVPWPCIQTFIAERLDLSAEQLWPEVGPVAAGE